MSHPDYVISELFTHAAPMILIDTIDQYSEDALQTKVTITAASPFLYGGSVPAYVGLEYMAQSVACFSGIRARNADQPIREGYLISTRRLSLNRQEFSLGETLTIHVSLVHDFGDMSSFDCQVNKGETMLANARLNVYQPLEFEGTNLRELG